MKKSIRFNALFMALAVLFAACEDDSPEVIDTTPPTAVVGLPLFVEPGGELEVVLTLADDIALGEVRIDIHPVFDDHEHEGARLKAVPFETTIILDEMQGEEDYNSLVPIAIPQDAATGPYHLQINYFDAAGNEGELVVNTFEIVSETASPAVSITNFTADEELELNENGILVLEGTIESRTAGGLDEVHITVLEEEEEHTHGRIRSSEPLFEQEWELNGADTFVFQEQISAGIDLSGAAAGHYILRIFVRDVESNVKIVEREIHVD